MIGYNELYELLRKEKYNEVLQQLPKGFLGDASDYLRGQREELIGEEDPFSDSSIKLKKQLENSISLFKELIRIRKKKILNLSFVGTETGIMKRDYENLLPFEKDIFESLVKTFEEGDKALTKFLNGKKEEAKTIYKMIIFSQDVEQFVDMGGNIVGPFKAGQLVNLENEIAQLFVSDGKASFVDE